MKKYPMFLSILLLSILGLLLRLNNISPFKFYPDSYQNLVVAQNIIHYQSVVGPMGPEGMIYPYYFMWSRPIFPLVIDLFQFFKLSPENAAIIISLLSSILIIPLSYFFIANLFHSKRIGLCAAILSTISFNISVWSGFIYTESIAIFVTTVFLFFLFRNIQNKSNYFTVSDVITGILLAIATFTRYEYSMYYLITLIVLITYTPFFKQKIVTIFISSFLTTVAIILLLYPIQDLFFIVRDQLDRLLIIGIIGAFIIGIFYFIIKFVLIKKEKIFTHSLILMRSITILFFLFLLLKMIFPSFLPDVLSAPAKFFRGDFLLAIFVLIGTNLLLIQKQTAKKILISLAAIILLWPIYNAINPEMERYWTHLYPFLLIPASYALAHCTNFITQSKRPIGLLLFLLILLLSQLIHSFIGIKNWNNGEYFKKSYEEKSAQLLTSLINEPSSRLHQVVENQNPILLASLPEPYYLYTNISTQSLMNQKPYILIDPTLDNSDLIIINDIGMQDLFPNFSSFVEKNLTKNNKVAEYYVHEPYHFGTKRITETKPVSIFQIKISELKKQINLSQ